MSQAYSCSFLCWGFRPPDPAPSCGFSRGAGGSGGAARGSNPMPGTTVELLCGFGLWALGLLVPARLVERGKALLQEKSEGFNSEKLWENKVKGRVITKTVDAINEMSSKLSAIDSDEAQDLASSLFVLGESINQLHHLFSTIRTAPATL
eukprot:13655225-Alexandrium_andersonii.AAC.1